MEDEVNSYFVDFEDALSARRSLARIANDGMAHPNGFAGLLPGLESTGARFRDSDFSADVERALILPALRMAVARRPGFNQRWCGTAGYTRGAINILYGAKEVVLRPLLLLVWALTWVILRVVTRVTFTFSKEPAFEVLGILGGENTMKRAVPVDCVRICFPALARHVASTILQHTG